MVVGSGTAAFQHDVGKGYNRIGNTEDPVHGNCTVRDRRIKLGLHSFCGEGGKIRVDGFQVIVHGICHFHRDFSGAVNGQARSETGDLEFIRKCDGRDVARKGDHAAGSVIGGDQTVLCIINGFTQRGISVKRVQCIVGCRDLKGRCFQCVKRVGTRIVGEGGQNAAHCIPVGIFVLRCGEDFAPGQTVGDSIGSVECVSCRRCIRCVHPFAVAEVVIHAVKFADQRTGVGGGSGSGNGNCAVRADDRCRCAEDFFCCGSGIVCLVDRYVRDCGGDSFQHIVIKVDGPVVEPEQSSVVADNNAVEQGESTDAEEQGACLIAVTGAVSGHSGIDQREVPVRGIVNNGPDSRRRVPGHSGIDQFNAAVIPEYTAAAD